MEIGEKNPLVMSPRPEAEFVEAEVEGSREREAVSPAVNSREGGHGREISQSQGSFEMTDEIEGGKGRVKRRVHQT